MNSPILTPQFQHPADGWYQIEALGRHPNPVAGVVQVIDDTAAASIVNRFNADAAAGRLRHGAEMLIDHEHFRDQPDQETRAYGWLQELRQRTDGIYGRIRWTATGKPAVDGGDYRFFSTEYAPADLETLKNGAANEVRPLRLDGLTLTNMNNNLGQKPITNSRRDGHAGRPAGNQPTNHPTHRMNQIALKLGLPGEAGEDALLAEVTRLLNRAQTLETENQTLLAEQVDALLDAHGLPPGDRARVRLKSVLTGLKNRADRTAALLDFGFLPVAAAGGPAGPDRRKLHNRETVPPALRSVAGEGESARAARQAESVVQEYRLRNRCTYDQARQAVRRTHPELFSVTH